MLSGGGEVLAFAVGVGDGVNVAQEVVGRGLGRGLGIGVGGEEGGGDHVHALVGALRREDNGHQQLERRAVVQLGFRHRHGLLEALDDLVISVL